MFVCVCNAIREKDVRAAVRGGAKTVAGVMAHHRCKHKCALCVHHTRSLIADEALVA